MHVEVSHFRETGATTHCDCPHGGLRRRTTERLRAYAPCTACTQDGAQRAVAAACDHIAEKQRRVAEFARDLHERLNKED